MIEVKKKQQDDTFDKDRREALKKLGAIGIAAATAPAMMTLLQATQASAQSVPGGGGDDEPEDDCETCCETHPEHPECQEDDITVIIE